MSGGQFNAKMARMKPGMMEIDTGTIKENVVTEEEHYFHEGSYLIKRDGLYYLVYADVSREVLQPASDILSVRHLWTVYLRRSYY